jgi:CxxC-x17-CxxC domain-containing protein
VLLVLCSMTDDARNSQEGHRVTFADKTLTCADCGAPFTFTSGEQEFHASKGFTNEPRRCPACRASRRAQRDDYGGGRSSSGGSYGGGGYGGERQMFSATCSSCGKEARVPFEPRGDKPVYCSDCFRSQGQSRGGSSYGGGAGGRGSSYNRW